MFDQGVVKFFDSRKEKRYGFLILEDGTEIFFHFNDGQIILPGEEEPEFSGKSTMVIKGKPMGLRDPQKDDKIVFHRSPGYKGDKASPWDYLSHVERAQAIIAKRPPPTTYRVLKTMNSIGEQPGAPQVLWQGSSIAEVLRKFPLPRGNQSPSADPLLPYYSDSDNIFEVNRWWEKQEPDGSWVRCDDPRPLSGVLRTFEAINRR